MIIGAESEQRVTLIDVGMGFLWDRGDTTSGKVGAPALRHCLDQAGRLKLVGLRVAESTHPPSDGSVVISRDRIVGYICTTRRSESLGWQYALALIEDGQAPEGGTLTLYENPGADRGRYAKATVVAPPFYDPEGERLRS